jgi:hypothetical protein
VELPGIEPAAKKPATWGQTEYDYAKRRETTWNDLRIQRTVLTASTRRSRLPRCYRTHAARVAGATEPAPNGRSGLLLSDLAVWNGHVAMVVGNGMMVEAGDPVQLSPIRTTNAGQGFRRQVGEHRGYEFAGAEVPRLMPLTAINLRRS